MLQKYQVMIPNATGADHPEPVCQASTAEETVPKKKNRAVARARKQYMEVLRGVRPRQGSRARFHGEQFLLHYIMYTQNVNFCRARGEGA
jgi:hypothetical protein